MYYVDLFLITLAIGLGVVVVLAIAGLILIGLIKLVDLMLL
jgi:hypothetical protein